MWNSTLLSTLSVTWPPPFGFWFFWVFFFFFNNFLGVYLDSGSLLTWPIHLLIAEKKGYHPKRIFVVISSTMLRSLDFDVRRGSRRRGSLAARFLLAASSKLISTQTSSFSSREPIIFSLRVFKSKETQYPSVRSFGFACFLGLSSFGFSFFFEFVAAAAAAFVRWSGCVGPAFSAGVLHARFLSCRIFWRVCSWIFEALFHVSVRLLMILRSVSSSDSYRVFSLSLAKKKKKQGVSLSDRCSEVLGLLLLLLFLFSFLHGLFSSVLALS